MRCSCPISMCPVHEGAQSGRTCSASMALSRSGLCLNACCGGREGDIDPQAKWGLGGLESVVPGLEHVC